MSMRITQLTPDRQEWPSLVAHLKAADHAQWVLDESSQPLEEDLIFLAALVEKSVVGSLTLIRKEIIMPETEWAAERDRLLRDQEGTPLFETLVQTFFVEEEHRRRGIGRALQLEALTVTKETSCIQMRSWSSLDKPANYQLKLDLGFGFHPEVQQTPSGLVVSGGYFVKRV